MKKLILLVVAMTFAGLISAQTPESPEAVPLAEMLQWMTGTWEGEGVAAGKQEFTGKMECTSDLDGQAILIRRESLSKPGNPSGGTKELMIIGVDGTTKKIVLSLYTSSNSIGIFSGETKDNEIVFTSVIQQPGYVNKRTFKLLPSGVLSFVIEGATPGKEVSKMVEINFKKKL